MLRHTPTSLRRLLTTGMGEPDKVPFCGSKGWATSAVLLSDENVGGFDIAVDDPFGVRSVERIGYFDGQAEQGIGVERPASDAMFQRHAF